MIALQLDDWKGRTEVRETNETEAPGWERNKNSSVKYDWDDVDSQDIRKPSRLYSELRHHGCRKSKWHSTQSKHHEPLYQGKLQCDTTQLDTDNSHRVRGLLHGTLPRSHRSQHDPSYLRWSWLAAVNLPCDSKEQALIFRCGLHQIMNWVVFWVACSETTGSRPME